MSRSGRRTLGQAPERAATRRASQPDVPEPAPHDLEDEAKIAASRVREVFTPHQPVQPGRDLAGRDREHRKIVGALNTPGQHAMITGEHGVGRSSLANVAGHTYAQATAWRLFSKQCDHVDSFESILYAPLREAGLDSLVIEYVREDVTTKKGEFGASTIAKGGRERQTGSAVTYRPNKEIGASVAAGYLAERLWCVLIDGLERVHDLVALYKLAELAKQLSDRAANLKLLLVGDAATANHLAAIPHVVQLPLHVANLALMCEDDLRDIVTRGGDELGLSFDDEVSTAIAWASAGYPHFTHLVALRCAEHAILSGRRRIERSDLARAMTAAAEDADNTLRHQYATSVGQQENRGAVLMAAASLDDNEFTTPQLRLALDGQLDPTGPLRQLVSDDGSTVLRRIDRGVYEFTDPRMRSYVRLAHGMTALSD